MTPAGGAAGAGSFRPGAPSGAGSSRPGRGIRFALIAMACFAVQDGTSKHLGTHYPPEFFIMVRYWLFAAFVAVIAARRAGGLRVAARTRMPLLQSFRGVLLAVQIIVMTTSFVWIGLAETHAVFALHPLLATLIAVPLLGERIGWRRAGAIGVGFLGVLVILRPGLGVLRVEALLPLIAAAMMATYTVTTRMVSHADGSAAPAFFYLGVAGAGALTLVGPFYWTPMAPVDWGWLALHSVVAMFGHYCLIAALEATEAVRIQPFTYLQVVYAIIVGAVVFGERIDLAMLAGMALVVGAGLYAIWREAHFARRAALAPAGSRGHSAPGGGAG
ncbi:MAG TPA: DMT family transporter [Thermohalobaculum sp.]|nr:DMT family transporter [Thermohalobaculum sp.]